MVYSWGQLQTAIWSSSTVVQASIDSIISQSPQRNSIKPLDTLDKGFPSTGKASRKKVPVEKDKIYFDLPVLCWFLK